MTTRGGNYRLEGDGLTWSFGTDPGAMTRAQRVDALIRFFGQVLAEDGRDGTPFDNEIIDALTPIRDRLEREEQDYPAATEE